MSVEQSFGTRQEWLHDLAELALNIPELRRALEEVALEQPRPRAQIYINRPSLLDEADAQEHNDPFFAETYRIGVKVTYFSKSDGMAEQFGQLMHISGLRDGLVERSIYIMAQQLAKAILEHAQWKKPLPMLPIKELSPRDREEMRLPF